MKSSIRPKKRYPLEYAILILRAACDAAGIAASRQVTRGLRVTISWPGHRSLMRNSTCSMFRIFPIVPSSISAISLSDPVRMSGKEMGSESHGKHGSYLHALSHRERNPYQEYLPGMVWLTFYAMSHKYMTLNMSQKLILPPQIRCTRNYRCFYV